MTNVSNTSNKSALLIAAAIVVLGVLAYFLLFQSDEQIELTDTTVAELNLARQEKNSGSQDNTQEKLLSNHQASKPLKSQENISTLKLLGVVVSDDSAQSSATIESESQARTYYINDPIAFSEVSLVQVLFDRVILRNEENDEMTLMLDTSAPDHGDFYTDDTNDTPDSLTVAEQKALAKSIGNRPKELEHIVKTTPIGSSDGSDGLAVSPGLNPSLFRSAGFKEGDVLKEVNGFDLSIAEQYAQAMAAIPNAHTLEFTVIRGGRTITIYLDIPSEGLTLGD